MNYPTIPIPSGWPDQRQDPNPGPANRAGLHAVVWRKQSAGCSSWSGSDEGGQVQPFNRGQVVYHFPGPAFRPRIVAGGLSFHWSLLAASPASAGRVPTPRVARTPALIDPKVNFTLVKRQALVEVSAMSMKYIWMAVEDNNPLYGSFTFSGGYSRCSLAANDPGCSNPTTTVADNYWADFLFGTTSPHTLLRMSLSRTFCSRIRASTRRTTGRFYPT